MSVSRFYFLRFSSCFDYRIWLMLYHDKYYLRYGKVCYHHECYHHEDERLLFLLLFTFSVSYWLLSSLATLTLSDYCTRFTYLFVYGTRVILLLSPYVGSRFACKLGHVPRIRKHTLLVLYSASMTTNLYVLPLAVHNVSHHLRRRRFFIGS